MKRAGDADGHMGSDAVAAARERLLEALPSTSIVPLAHFEAVVRAEERRRSALEFAELQAMAPAPSAAGMSDAALAAAFAAEASDGPLAYCGPDELMRLLMAELEKDGTEPPSPA